MFLFYVELFVAIIFVVGWITQVVLPTKRGEPKFPLFWSREQRLVVKEKRIRQQLNETKLEERVESLEEEYVKTRSASKDDND